MSVTSDSDLDVHDRRDYLDEAFLGFLAGRDDADPDIDEGEGYQGMDEPEAGFTVASWNIARQASPRMLTLINALSPDLLLLQEVTVETIEHYRSLPGFEWCRFSLDLRPREPGEGRGRALGTAILGSSRVGVVSAEVVHRDGIARPERVLAADVLIGQRPERVKVVAYHALNGRHGDDELDKPRTSATLAGWLEDQQGAVLLGMDANSPDVDHPNPERVECCFAQPESRDLERRLLHPRCDERKHRLEDVWRTYLQEHPRVFAELRRRLPEGPLAVSHFTGRKALRLPRRYDHLWATPDFRVLTARYMPEGFIAGSDHAVVWAQLAFG